MYDFSDRPEWTHGEKVVIDLFSHIMEGECSTHQPSIGASCMWFVPKLRSKKHYIQNILYNHSPEFFLSPIVLGESV